MLGGADRRAIDLLGRPIDALTRPDDQAFVVLTYHRIGGRSPSPVDLPADTFDEQLDILAATARVIGLADAITGLGEPAAAADDDRRCPAVVLTFDDGTADWVDDVAPRLARRRFPATFYVATDFVDGERAFPNDGRPISWAGLAELASIDGVTVGSHTHTHLVLNEADALTAASEVDRSIGLIEDHVGVPCRHFAYPRAVAGSPAAEVVIRRRFASAVLAGNRANSSGADRHRLGRHSLTVADTMGTFRRKLDGGMVLEGWLRERRDAWRA